MPNYIKNRIELIGSKEQVGNFFTLFSSSYPATDMKPAWIHFPDFNKIVQMPESLNIESDSYLMPLENQFSYDTRFKDHLDKIRQVFSHHLSEAESKKNKNNFLKAVENYIDHGHASWYTWCKENWGVKWNSSECERIDEHTFDFITPWNGVPKLIKIMSEKFKEVVINYQFSSEDIGCNCGRGRFQDGKSDFITHKNGTVAAYELAFKLWPNSKQDYELINGKYGLIPGDELPF